MNIGDLLYQESFDTNIEWVRELGKPGEEIFGAKIDDEYIEIQYQRVEQGKAVYISFTRNHSLGITGGGKAMKIFGAVINHMIEYVNKNRLNRVYFSAYKPQTGPFGTQDTSRSNLYQRMIQKFADQIGFDFKVDDSGNEDTFTLTRKNIKDTAQERYTAREWAIIDGGHTLEETGPKHKLFDFGKY